MDISGAGIDISGGFVSGDVLVYSLGGVVVYGGGGGGVQLVGSGQHLGEGRLVLYT